MPLRSVRIIVRSASLSQGASSGEPYQIHQASSQTNPIAPNTTKAVRQSKELTSAAVRMAPTAGPAEEPPLNKVVTKPRSRSGNHWRIAPPQAGNVVASLAPITSRASRMVTKLPAAAVSAVAVDQMVMPPPIMFLMPTRSTSNPSGTRHTT